MKKLVLLFAFGLFFINFSNAQSSETAQETVTVVKDRKELKPACKGHKNTDCKGKSDCKGQASCKGKNGCKDKAECKGRKNCSEKTTCKGKKDCKGKKTAACKDAQNDASSNSCMDKPKSCASKNREWLCDESHRKSKAVCIKLHTAFFVISYDL